MNLISYNEAKEYVLNNKDKLRVVVSTHNECTKYQTVCETLKRNNISFMVMNSEDPENFFKSGVSPTTFFFNEKNVCYPFYDIFNDEMLAQYIEIINYD
jgi:hypothetical protein